MCFLEMCRFIITISGISISEKKLVKLDLDSDSSYEYSTIHVNSGSFITFKLLEYFFMPPRRSG